MRNFISPTIKRSLPLLLVGTLLFPSLTTAQEDVYELEGILATANRIEDSATAGLEASAVFSSGDFQDGEFRDVAEALAAEPNFGAFRQTNATAAHPTTQGVRLRHNGANATSRTLVLLDGVPQNDPFGGWLYWNLLDPGRLDSVSIHTGAASQLWGNLSSGGAISAVSRELLAGEANIRASLGSSGLIDFRAQAASTVSASAVVDFSLRSYQSDGFYTLSESQRGSVDQRANSEALSAQAALTWGELSPWKSRLSFSALDEERQNGTELARNDTQAFDLSFITQRAIPEREGTFNLSLYWQDREFQNVFTSVTEDRNSERPALDQYAVPSQAMGGGIVYRQGSLASGAFTAGADFRFTKGEVNERFRNLGAGFTRDRNAGGSQEFFGLFSRFAKSFGESNQLSATLRLDQIEQKDGRRSETDTTSNTVLLNETFANQSETELSSALSWRHQFSEKWDSEVSFSQGFRAPTLNELYRPFRVRNDITEANPDLVNERQTGFEAALARRASDSSFVKLSAFSFELDESIANVLLTTDSGFDPRFGFIPEGGSGSQRLNIDSSRVSGGQIQFEQALSNSLSAQLSAVYSETEVRGAEQSELLGNAFPQSPPWKAVLGIEWRPSEAFFLWSRYRWSDRSFENLSNSIRLGATESLSLGASYRISPEQSVHLLITNATDAENVTGIASNGLITIDEPRTVTLSYSWSR